eukprot:TRINITY_DN29573_c0_g1_i1.p1 TRINITY_DN29573_c0_g1~~TRINITY_DN29573_c0_g1_i1.p1  ORF type:complete len:781 (+),score=70.03 TRINITY_DN29573_c0_g1_i1:31-2373(+)
MTLHCRHCGQPLVGLNDLQICWDETLLMAATRVREYLLVFPVGEDLGVMCPARHKVGHAELHRRVNFPTYFVVDPQHTRMLFNGKLVDIHEWLPFAPKEMSQPRFECVKKSFDMPTLISNLMNLWSRIVQVGPSVAGQRQRFTSAELQWIHNRIAHAVAKQDTQLLAALLHELARCNILECPELGPLKFGVLLRHLRKLDWIAARSETICTLPQQYGGLDTTYQKLELMPLPANNKTKSPGEPDKIPQIKSPLPPQPPPQQPPPQPPRPPPQQPPPQPQTKLEVICPPKPPQNTDSPPPAKPAPVQQNKEDLNICAACDAVLENKMKFCWQCGKLQADKRAGFMKQRLNFSFGQQRFVKQMVKKWKGSNRISNTAVLPDGFFDHYLTVRSRTPCIRCGDWQREHELLLCDGCNSPWHMTCLDSPLSHIPRGDWFCSTCRADGTAKKVPLRLICTLPELHIRCPYTVDHFRSMEAFYFDSSRDAVLREWLTETIAHVPSQATFREAVVLTANKVATFLPRDASTDGDSQPVADMPGSSATAGETEALLVPLQAQLKQIKEYYGSIVFPIGALRAGKCRHHALLFKFLFDRVWPHGASVVRGHLDCGRGGENCSSKLGCHVWNELEDPRHKGRLVLDITNHGSEIVEDCRTYYHASARVRRSLLLESDDDAPSSTGSDSSSGASASSAQAKRKRQRTTAKASAASPPPPSPTETPTPAGPAGATTDTKGAPPPKGKPAAGDTKPPPKGRPGMPATGAAKPETTKSLPPKGKPPAGAAGATGQ